jgi:hypothetical protein
VIDIATREIIDYEIILGSKQYDKGNTEEPSTNMEREAVRRILDRWNRVPLSKVYVHDNDGRTRAIFEEFGEKWEIDFEEVLDYNHSAKNVKKALATFSDAHRGIFQGIGESLKKWLCRLLYEEMPQKDRLERWQNTWRHYNGEHDPRFCNHKEEVKSKWKPDRKYERATASGLFREFLKNTEMYAKKCRGIAFTSNFNESFNSVKAKLLPKDLKFSKSRELRVLLAIWKWNHAGDWELLRNHICLPALDPYYAGRLQKQAASAKKRNDKRRDPGVRKARRQREGVKRKAAARKEIGANGYGKECAVSRGAGRGTRSGK